MSSSWYFVGDGQRNGPMRREELDARVAEGAVDGDTLVWRPGMAAWEKASSVAELGVPALRMPPPLPPLETAAMFPETGGPGAAGGAGGCYPRTEASASPTRSRAPDFAGFRIRLAAKAIDWVVLYGFGTVVERVVVASVFGGVEPSLHNFPQLLRLVAYLAPINLCIALVYTVYFMRIHEATPGKRILGLRVVGAGGGRLGVGRIIGRFFAEILSRVTFFAGYVMAAFDDEKRTLHDYMCDTRVVRGPRETSRWEELRR